MKTELVTISGETHIVVNHHDTIGRASCIVWSDHVWELASEHPENMQVECTLCGERTNTESVVNKTPCPECAGLGQGTDVETGDPVTCPDCAGSGKAENSITVNEG